MPSNGISSPDIATATNRYRAALDRAEQPLEPSSMRRRAQKAGLWAVAAGLSIAGCSSSRPVDPLTARLAAICKLDAHALSYWGRGSATFAPHPPSYVWQTADAKHSVELAFPNEPSGSTQMFVSCDDNPMQRPLTVDRTSLPKESPAIGNGGG